MKVRVLAGLITAAIIAIGCGSSSLSQDEVNRLNELTETSTAAPKTTETAKKFITSGTWKIGAKEDLNKRVITAGDYVVRNPEDGFYCYWETVKNFNNDAGSLIANGNVDPGAEAFITIKSSAKGLEVQGDCIFAKEKK